MTFSKLSFVSALLISVATYAAPAAQQVLDSCVNGLLAQTTNTFAVAQACSGVQDAKVVIDCVQTLRQKFAFIMPDAGQACRGVKDVQALETCVTAEKKSGFNDEEVAQLCNQK